MNNIVWLLEFIKQLSKTGYTGKIEINFQFGGVTNVNTCESIKPPKQYNDSNKSTQIVQQMQNS